MLSKNQIDYKQMTLLTIGMDDSKMKDLELICSQAIEAISLERETEAQGELIMHRESQVYNLVCLLSEKDKALEEISFAKDYNIREQPSGPHWTAEVAEKALILKRDKELFGDF